MSKQRCSSQAFWKAFLELDIYRLVGGVLLVFALALIPNSTHALTINTYYYANISNGTSNLYFGCNTVVSDGGWTVLANRGSLVQQAVSVEDNFPCGYRYENGQYDYHPNWYDSSTPQNRLTGGATNTWLGSFNGSWNYPSIVSNSLQEGSYIGGNYHSILHDVKVGWTNAYHDFNIIPASNSDDTLFDSNFIFVGLNVGAGGLNASVPDLSFEYLFKNGQEMSLPDQEQLYSDIFSHSIIGAGSPKDYLEDTFYNELKTQYNITNEADWDNNNFYWYLAFLPRYSQSWSFDGNIYLSCSVYCKEVYPDSLSFASIYGVNGWSFDYLGVSPVYDNQNDYLTNWNNISSSMVMCVSSACREKLDAVSSRVATEHNQQWNGWIDPASNPAQSWFNVFEINMVFPFSSFFSSLTNNSCVDIPIMASWLHTSQSHVCTYWSNDIRNTLTPVFMSLSTLLLFGFIVSWLKGNSNNAFRDNDTTRLGDRF